MLCLVFRSGAPTCVLDFRVPPLRFKVHSTALSRSFWTSSCLTPPLQSPIRSSSRPFWTSAHLPTTSKSNPPLFLAPFGLSPASPPLQSPICHSSRSFWTSSHLPPPQSPIRSSCSLLLDFRASPSTSKSILPLFLAPFGLPRASPPPQSPILRSFSLLLDFLVPPLRLKVHSATLPLPTTQKRRIAKQSASPILHQPIPPSKAPAISATSASGTRTYLPSGTNHFPIGLSTPALTASTANFFPATQKNIIAASIAPSGQI